MVLQNNLKKKFEVSLYIAIWHLLMFFPHVGPAIHTTMTAEAVGPGIYQGDAFLVPQAFVSMETENQDPDEEEKIVYL